MLQKDLFGLALGVSEPWFVSDVSFDVNPGSGVERGELHIRLDFREGSKFACADCGTGGLEVYDTKERKWQHMNFFQHKAFLHARVPRVRCSGCGVRQVFVPWARPGSGFTLLFEAMALLLVAEMPVLAASRLLGVRDTRIWRILRAYVEAARSKVDMSEVTAVAADETASRRGHTYVTLFADLEPGSSRVLFATPGKDQTTFDRFLEDLKSHGGDAEKVRDVVTDMSAAFAAGAAECFPGAEVTYDKFHVVKLVTDVVDETRRLEAASRPELKRTRYIFLTNNPLNLTERQLEQGSSSFRVGKC